MAKTSVPCPFCNSYDVHCVPHRLFEILYVCDHCGSFSPCRKTVFGAAKAWFRRFPRVKVGSLLSCPFCGSHFIDRFICTFPDVATVHCSSCNAMTAPCKTIEEAVALWNQEVSSDAEVYVIREYVPCEECGYFVNGKCDVPDEVYEYTCPYYNDPDPKYIPAEVE